MALMGFGKRPKHRSFDYTPRYYDPDKDDLKRRMAPYLTDKEKSVQDADAVKSRIRGSFKRSIGTKYESDLYKQSLRRSNRIVMIVAVGLIALTLFFLLEYLPEFLEAFD